MVPVRQAGFFALTAIVVLATTAADADAHDLLPARSAFENGFVHTLLIIEHVLPTTALGLACGQLTSLGSARMGALFLAGAAIGVLLVTAERIEVEWSVFAPAALFLSGGLPLLATGWNVAAALVVAAPVVALLLGLSVALETWGREGGTWFNSGALLAAVSIASLAALPPVVFDPGADRRELDARARGHSTGLGRPGLSPLQAA